MKKLLMYLFVFLTIVSLLLLPLDSDNAESVRTSFMIATVISILVTMYKDYFAGISTLIVAIFVVGQILHPTEKPFSFEAETLMTMTEYFVQGVILNFFVYILQRAHSYERHHRKKFQTILSSIGEAVIATDRKCRITYMNATAQKFTGWHYRDARKKPIEEVMNFQEKTLSDGFKKAVRRTIQEGKRSLFAQAADLISKDTQVVTIDDSIAPLRNSRGEVVGAVIIFDDISEHKHQEERLELLLSSVSHELKNYITSIQGYSSILEKKLKQTSQSELHEYSQKLSNKIGTMTSMITSMFDLSKLKMGKLDMKRDEFDLLELIETIVQDTELNLKNRIKILSSKHVTVFADKVRIGQVLTNLLTNAIKYSDTGTDISVQMRTIANMVLVTVEDKGKGIPQEKLEKVFRPFYRALEEKDRNSISGSGLGLYISREIVRQHGGRMWVESIEGKGSRFYFTLPFESAETISETEDEAGLLVRIREVLSVHE
ncbi:PAS domain S-box protein [Candidatus Roizmanbacteria bacterium]|nr:MAG: PAS domain S-box protein [Candidatus Roizmanbacteria bacterium]